MLLSSEVSDGFLDGGAPPGEVQLHVHLLVHTDDIEPDDDVRIKSGVGPQRIKHIEEQILPVMIDNYHRRAHRGIADDSGRRNQL